MHDPDNQHWVMVAKGFLDCDDVLAYDCLTFEPSNRKHVLRSIRSLIPKTSSNRTYCVKSCQKQKNGHDSGLCFERGKKSRSKSRSFFCERKSERAQSLKKWAWAWARPIFCPLFFPLNLQYIHLGSVIFQKKANPKRNYLVPKTIPCLRPFFLNLGFSNL